MKSYLFASLFLILSFTCNSQTPLDPQQIDPALLNTFIVKEVNELRKKEKADPLYLDDRLLPPATDHASYMLEKEKLTHFQRKKDRKTPKNRVDRYGHHFNRVGENVQLAHLSVIPKEIKLKPRPEQINTYELLAKVLVTNWKNSPPHYKNMISTDYTTTQTAIKIGPNGEIYACQLLGSDGYEYPDEFKDSIFPYKPESDRKCRKCLTTTNFGGHIILRPDSTIVYAADCKKNSLKRLIFWPFRDGIAADIVLKEQYPCDTNNVFNGHSGIRGIPLKPVFRKSFRKGNNAYSRNGVYIELGKLPRWIDQDFEINLTLIKKKRTCSSVVFHTIPASVNIQIPMKFSVDTAYQNHVVTRHDSLTVNVSFDRSKVDLKDTSIYRELRALGRKINPATKAVIHSYASIEGSREGNAVLFEQRARQMKKVLVEMGCDSTRITVTAEENFRDFRKDIKGTSFSYLGNLNDDEIRTRLQERSLRDSLEPLLKTHRYASVDLVLTWKDTLLLTVDLADSLFKQAILKKDISSASNLMSYLSGEVMKKTLSMNVIDSLDIPLNKAFIPLHYQRTLLRNEVTSAEDSLERVNGLIDELVSYLNVDPKSIEVNTHFYYTVFLAIRTQSLEKREDFIKELAEIKHIDPAIRARMILDLITDHDIINFIWNRGRPYLYSQVKNWLLPADLTEDELFGMAEFLAFFSDYKGAYDIARQLIDNERSADQLVFFLKMCSIKDLGISHKKYMSYFERIRILTGKEFCTYFNTPYLNFQIMDDPSIKEIYCRECADQ